jgi:hypothetical protein
VCVCFLLVFECVFEPVVDAEQVSTVTVVVGHIEAEKLVTVKVAVGHVEAENLSAVTVAVGQSGSKET